MRTRKKTRAHVRRSTHRAPHALHATGSVTFAFLMRHPPRACRECSVGIGQYGGHGALYGARTPSPPRVRATLQSHALRTAVRDARPFRLAASRVQRGQPPHAQAQRLTVPARLAPAASSPKPRAFPATSAGVNGGTDLVRPTKALCNFVLAPMPTRVINLHTLPEWSRAFFTL